MDHQAEESGLRGMLALVRRAAGELGPALVATAVMAVPLFVLAFSIFLTVVVSAIAFLQSDNEALNEIGRRLSELTLSEVLAFVTSLVRDYPVVAVGAGALSILSVGFATIRAVVAQVMNRFDDADADLQGRILALERRIAQQNDLLLRLAELEDSPSPAAPPPPPPPLPQDAPLQPPLPPAGVFTPRDAAEQALRLMADTLALQATIMERRALPPWDARSLAAIRHARLAPPPAFLAAESREERIEPVADGDPPKRQGFFGRNIFKDGLFDKPGKSASSETMSVHVASERGVPERTELVARVNAVNRAIIAHTSNAGTSDLAPTKVRDRIDRLAKAVDEDVRLLQDLLYRIVAKHGEDLAPRFQEMRQGFAARLAPTALG